MKVKALQNGFTGLITNGKEYEVLKDTSNYYQVKDDKGKVAKYPKLIFEEVKKSRRQRKKDKQMEIEVVEKPELSKEDVEVAESEETVKVDFEENVYD